MRWQAAMRVHHARLAHTVRRLFSSSCICCMSSCVTSSCRHCCAANAEQYFVQCVSTTHNEHPPADSSSLAAWHRGSSCLHIYPIFLVQSVLRPPEVKVRSQRKNSCRGTCLLYCCVAVTLLGSSSSCVWYPKIIYSIQ